MNKKQRVALSILLVAAALAAWLAWGNAALMKTTITVCSNRIPKAFSGYRIAQISDLHNAEFGKDNARLVQRLADCQPDCIVLTGDLVDSRRTNIDVSLTFAAQAAKIAPTYYITGNHESRLSNYDTLRDGLTAAGVTILQDRSVTLERDGEQITLAGVTDPAFLTNDTEKDAQIVQDEIQSVMPQTANYTILLSHRPELFSTYVTAGVDLVFCGHAHGGQVRIPGIGGLFAPGQGLLPEYDSGMYTDGTTNMIVSRGLGNSLFPFRINDRPEIVVAELAASR